MHPSFKQIGQEVRHGMLDSMGCHVPLTFCVSVEIFELWYKLQNGFNLKLKLLVVDKRLCHLV